MEWTAPHVRALRDAYRLTRDEFAEAIGAAPKSIQNWESGTVRKISPVMQRALDDTLERATPEQQQRFWTQVDPARGQGEATDRRQALRVIGSVAGGLATSAYLESIELDRHLEASDLGVTTLQQLDLTVDRLGDDYLYSPPSQTFEEARLTRNYVVQLLNARHTLAQRAQLYSVAGWLSALIGHVSFDLGEDPGVIDGHSGTALHLAREIDHGELTGWVRGTQALAATFQDRPEDAIQLAQAGRDTAPEDSIVTVRLFAQEARAHARAGHRAAAEHALAEAERTFDHVGDATSTSIFSFAYPYVPYYAGTCYSWLERPEHAEPCSREAIELCDAASADWPVARVFARIDLAEVLIQRGELDEAMQLAQDCLAICAGGRRTQPTRTRLAELLHDLRMKRGVSPMRELDERFHAVFAN